MDEFNTYMLSKSTARAKLLLDANILIYAQEAFNTLGIHLLNYLDRLEGLVDWYVASCVAVKLHNGGSYDLSSLNGKILNCDGMDSKMDSFPYIKEDGSLGFVKLNALAGDDWAQVALAHNIPDLIVVTNDSAMFKSAHASLNGRAIAFHQFLEDISNYWTLEQEWQSLSNWLMETKKPLRNNSSWTIEGQERKKSTRS